MKVSPLIGRRIRIGGRLHVNQPWEVAVKADSHVAGDWIRNESGS